MAKPRGSLTAVQYRIMELVWDAGDVGLGVTDVWDAIAGQRKVTRTTVLNLMDRLAKRGWLQRRSLGNAFLYSAAASRDWAESHLASSFIKDFFGGSATQLVRSLVSTQGLSSDDIASMRDLLATAPKRTNRARGRA